METQPIRVLRHDSALGASMLVRRAPRAALAPYIIEISGWVETRAGTPSARLEAPIAGMVMVLNFGEPYRITGPGNREGRAAYPSFVSGITDAPVTVDKDGLGYCVQVNLTPIGGYLTFGLPMSELANRAVGVEDLLGPSADALVAQLEDIGDWGARFDIVESMIARRIASARPVAPEVWHAWTRLSETGGAAPVQSLATETGWSRKHLTTRFREQVGLPPKSIARILRFNAAVRRINASGNKENWAAIALASGYYDQAHFNHDFREFTGVTPGDYLARMIPDGGVRA